MYPGQIIVTLPQAGAFSCMCQAWTT